MNIEKKFLLRNGRIVSVTRAPAKTMEVLTPSGLDVSVKEPRDEFFHAPIGQRIQNTGNLNHWIQINSACFN